MNKRQYKKKYKYSVYIPYLSLTICKYDENAYKSYVPLIEKEFDKL